MKRLLIFLTLVLLLCFNSCGASVSDVNQPDNTLSAEVVIPPLGNTDREIVRFSDIVYSRPDTDALIALAKEINEAVKDNAYEWEALTDKIFELDEAFASFDSMRSYLMIETSKDMTDTALSDEYELLSSKAPAIERAIEELMVTLATSEWARRLEDEVFGEGFIEEYADGSRFTDYVTELLEKEEKLKSEYLALNESAASERGADIFIELLKTRRLLADAYGDTSYADYSYEALGHGYTTDMLDEFTKALAEYAVPIYTALSQRAFAGYFKTHGSPVANRATVINNLYSIFSNLDPEIASCYSYMLNGNLFSVEHSTDERRSGAFTVFLSDLNAPYVFATFDESICDYMTLSHEFGHFYDDFTNYGQVTSLDLCEISSQALELLALTEFKEILTANEYKYLYYSQMKSILEVLIIQAFYARFEALAYALPYEDITREAINGLVVQAAEDMHLNPSAFKDLSSIIIIHLIDTPFYVQSYCTSLIASLDIFFKECAREGDGVTAYKALIDRKSSESFTEALSRANITSPFAENAVKYLLDEIHYSILGSHYYYESDDKNNAA